MKLPEQTYISDWLAGDQQAASQFAKLVYPMMRTVAANQLRRIGGQLTLSPTEFAHEAFLRLGGLESKQWHSPAHCRAFLASVMRFVIVDYMRERSSAKRGSGESNLSIDAVEEVHLGGAQETYGLIKVNQAIEALEALDPDCARVVELKLFSDLDGEAIAGVCNCSTATVSRHWRFAKAWLNKAISDHD